MANGIIRNNDLFLIEEFETYDNIPLRIIMPQPRHNSNYKLIEPVNYSLTDDIEFSWTESWDYQEPAYLYISAKLNETDNEVKIVERLGNATIENVVFKLNEYLKIDKISLFKKRIVYLELTTKKETLRAKTKYEELQKKYDKSEIQLKTLQKSNDDLLTLLKSK